MFPGVTEATEKKISFNVTFLCIFVYNSVKIVLLTKSKIMENLIKMIFTDPMNERLPEGEAFLLCNTLERPIGFHNGYAVELWSVKMIDTGKVGERLILIK